MAERYWLQRASFGEGNEIDAAQAREYFEAAGKDPDADRVGDLEHGFDFFRTDDGLQLVRWHVRPVAD